MTQTLGIPSTLSESKAMLSPPGDQMGHWSKDPLCVMRVFREPSACIVTIDKPPTELESELNAISRSSLGGGPITSAGLHIRQQAASMRTTRRSALPVRRQAVGTR